MRIAALLICLFPAAARAGVVVQQGAALPFEADDVTSALAARRVEADVLLSGDATAVRIDAAGRSRLVTLDGLAGRDAARLVALHALDLIMAPAPLPAEPVLTASRSRGPGMVLAAQLGVGSGLGTRQLRAVAVGVDVIVPIGPLRLVAGLGWWHAPTVAADTPREASFDAWSLRMRLRLPLGPVALSAGGFLAPYRFSDVASGVVGGATVEGMARVRLSGRLSGFAVLAGDVYAHQVRLVADGVVLFATPRVAASLSVGLAWELGG